MIKVRLANPCQNKKEHDKRDKLNANDVFSTRPFVLKRGRPRKALKFPILRKSIFDITI